MKQVFQNPKSGKTRLEEIAEPRVRRGGILVKNNFSVVSVGTERGIIELSQKSLLEKAKERPDYVQKFIMLAKTKGLAWAWQVAQAKLATDIALGYSSAGEVVEVGPDVEGFRVGDKVACAGQDYASHAEVVFVPNNLAVKIPAGVSEREAAFSTLGSIAMQGVRRAELSPGETVGIVGLGFLGQIAARILQAYGHPVIGFDVNPAQIKFAKENGIDEAVVINDAVDVAARKFTDGRGLDAVLIYASTKSEAPLKLAVQISRDKGRIVQIGNIVTNIPWRDFYGKELTYHSSRSYGPGRYDPNYEEKGNDYPLGHVRWTERRNMEEFLRLLADKKMSVENLITREFDIDSAEAAYEYMQDPQGLLHGILLKYPHPYKKESKLVLPSTLPTHYALRTTHSPIRIGLIGMGAFMKGEILPHLKLAKGAEVRAIAHSKGLQAKEEGTKWGANYVTSDYKEILADKDIDLVIIATRHSAHAKMAVEVLEAGKNLYIEKPLALNEAELEVVMEAAKRSKGLLFVGFNRRFSKHITEAKRRFADAKTPLQMLYRVNVPLEEHWSHSPEEGGRLIGEGCHFVDALQYIAGSRAKRVVALGVPVGGAVAHAENFSFTIEYENGSVGTVVYSGLGNFRLPKEYIEIYGGGNIMQIDNFKDAKFIGAKKTENLSVSKQHKGYLEELDLLISAIREGAGSPIPLEDLYASHMTTFKVAEALQTGEAVGLEWE